MNEYAKDIIAYHEKLFGKMRTFETPGYPGDFLLKNEDECVMQSEYRSLVGKLLYYTIKIGPECGNAIRELTQHVINPGMSHWRALHRVVGYLRQKKVHMIVYKAPVELRSQIFVDSNYETNTETRRSISGYIATIGGMISGWMSKMQRTVTLSSTEAEYVALALSVQETLFQNHLLEELGVGKKPGIVYEDKIGAIFLVENSQVGARTKHIDVRYHFMREAKERIFFCKQNEVTVRTRYPNFSESLSL